MCLSSVCRERSSYVLALGFEPGFSRQSIALVMWMLYLRVTRICGHSELVQVAKKQAFIRITAFRVVMWGIWFPEREVCSSKPSAERKRWPSTKDRPDGKPWQRYWPHYTTMQVHINKLRIQHPGLWVNYCGSKMKPITDDIAIVLDRISILASGQAILYCQIQSVELPSKVRLSEKSYWARCPFAEVCIFRMYLACPDWGILKVWYPYHADVHYNKRYNCTCTYLYNTLMCMHWCAWINPMSCLCMYMHAWHDLDPQPTRRSSRTFLDCSII